jgi:Leucine-rich repeat (LRR) protein
MKKLILSFLFFLFFFYTNAQVVQEDFEALVALYNATDGDNWYDNTGWSTTVNNVSNDWYGITVEGDSVVEIDLYFNSLDGYLPSEIGNITALRTLILRLNSIDGFIPDEISALENLLKLDISYNDFSGSFPTSVTSLYNLTYLDLDHNNFLGVIPSTIENLQNLDTLFLGFNDFNEISPGIGNLSNLKYLSLRSIDITYLIPEIGNLTNLTEINLYGNSISELPSEFVNLTNLQTLNLSFCNFSDDIPFEIWSLTALESMNLQNNELSGSIPTDIGNLVNLETLVLCFNNLSGSIPPELGYLSQINDIQLSNNQFEGEFPNILNHNISEIRISDNNLSGLPVFDSNCSNLVGNISVRDNMLDFGDIEPNFFLFENVPAYYPQADVPVEQDTIILPLSSELELTIDVGGDNNRYQWFKEGEPISVVSVSPEYSFVLNENDFSTYTCQITNNLLYYLTLTSLPIEVLQDYPPVISDIPDQTIFLNESFNTILLDEYVSDDYTVCADIIWTTNTLTNLIITIDDNRIATIEAVNPDWIGNETITFTAIDQQGSIDNEDAIFTILTPNTAPIIEEIPNQTIIQGDAFEIINLNDYVSDDYTPDDDIIWTTNTLLNLELTIDVSNTATIESINPGWFGNETITFTAEDEQGLTGSKDVLFTILENTAPVIEEIPDQTVKQGESFETINLNDYVSDDYTPDNDILWTANALSNLELTIDAGNTATIEPIDTTWYGSETITFTARDEQNLTDSHSAVFTIEEGNSIIGLDNNTFRVYINNNRIIIETKSSEEYQIVLYTAEGKVLFSSKISRPYYCLNKELKSGIYFLKVSNKNNNTTKKILIQ